MKKKIIGSLYYVVPLGIVVALIYLVISGVGPNPGETVESLGNLHIDSVDAPHAEYNTNPPTSGPHIGSIAKWGVHAQQLPDEIFIHNMEDGGVIIHYGPEVSAEDVEKMAAIVGKHHEGVILHPYVGLDTPIALTAWTRIEKLEGYDEDRITDFIRSYQGIDHHQR